ncbi:pseudouridine synthase [Thelonectria olida]|uniref:tRNA pseudouridine(55) synthase n=1 Tax=Thelonectria olida TaxID=1576542 RepID=A0A9P8WA49_9HYPO|nr:pseudouridine synthase [Thelonectria olida]
MASDIVREGVFAINKPCGQSSAQIIRECQKSFNPSNFFKPLIDAELSKRVQEGNKQFNRRKAAKKASQVKIGHGGTLDPLATGVLILGIGSGTKQLNKFLECTKTYETTILFGASTDTYDRVGRILTKRPYDHITREKVEEEIAKFKGHQVQIPPLYSALKMNGKPLYEYAREGKPIPREIEGRNVEVKDIELVEWYEPGKHSFRWPLEEAEAAERNLAEQVWRVQKQQETIGKKLSPKEKEEDDQAVAEHESFKRSFEERQDELIKDAPPKKSRHSKNPAMMSGALGQLPQPVYSDKGKNLVPDAPDANTPPPWSDKGPPAVKVRLTVTSGFYVRSFCHDLGAKLNSAALMSELCRSRQKDFTVGGTNCLEFDDLAKGEEVWGPKVADMLAKWSGASQSAESDNSSQKEKLPKKSKSPEDSPAEEKGKSRSASPSRKGEKRRRSESPAGPRKAAALESKETPSKPSTKSRSDDEKSWNGFDD